MALVRWGQMNAAGDITMAAIVNSSSSRTRSALTSLMSTIASGIISGNPTVVNAAAAAVTGAMASWGFALNSDIPQYSIAHSDANGVLSQLRIRASDGKFPDDVVSDFAVRAGLTPSTGTDTAPARGLGAFPIFAARAADARANARPCAVVFTGSSTTADNGVSQAQGYVSILMAAIQERWPSTLGTETTVQKSSSATFTPETVRGMHGYNAGEGGTTVLNYLDDAESDRIIALEPALIVHMIDSNDFKQQIPIATYEAALEARIAYINSRVTKPVQHILVHPYQRMDIASPSIPYSAYAGAQKAIAGRISNVKAIDISGAYAAVGVPGADPLGILRDDLVHQYANGYRFMGDLLIDRILG